MFSKENTVEQMALDTICCRVNSLMVAEELTG